jgi:predicted nucleotidyltransferase
LYETSVSDANAKTIIDEVVNSVPVESIILTGSRARGGELATSDYDIIAVIKTPLVPLYLRKLKNVSKRLTMKLGVKVEVNPLPTFIAQRAEGNLFLLKMKKEGKLFYGRDYLRLINSSNDLAIDWYFSYLSSLMKELLLAYNPNHVRCDASSTIYKIGKSLIQLAELVNASVAKKIRSQAHKILNECSAGLLSWFRVRDLVLDLFKDLVTSLLGTGGETIQDCIKRLLNVNKGKSAIKNLEYVALLVLSKGECPPLKGVFSRVLVQDRLRAALTLLLAGAKPNDVDRQLTSRAYCTIKCCFKVKHSKDYLRLWWNTKEAILSYWPYAHTVMGL